MCKVNTFRNADKRMMVITKNGKKFYSRWYADNNSGNEEIKEQAYEDVLKIHKIKETDVARLVVNVNVEDKDTVFISEHAMIRMKERNGWTRKTSVRMVKKIYETGLDPKQMKGKRATWAMRHSSGNCDLRYYGDFLYIFRDNILVTVIPEPQANKFSHEMAG